MIARHVLDSLLEGCQVISFDLRYLYVNDVVAQQGRRLPEELLGRTMAECYPGIDQTPMYATLGRCMAERLHLRMENEFLFEDGAKGWFELRFVPVPEGACILSLDITEQKRAAIALARYEEQSRHTQKIEAIGRLAAGVAHDFNSILSVILSYSGMLLADLNSADPMRESVTEIELAGQRAAALTRQLLTFSRNDVGRLQPVSLRLVVGGMENMLRRLLGVGAGVDLRVVGPESLGFVQADLGQMEQVVLNLAVNARDAMPGGGCLTIETANVDLDADYARAHAGVVAGPHVLLAVSDSGVGMDRDTQARMFEPFFTTKVVGKGTGLGLSTVLGIVGQNAGHVQVYSEPGAGTSVKVYFPRVEGTAHPEPAVSADSDAPGGTELILVVDDDAQLRCAVSAILRRRGYTAIEAPNGDAALTILREVGGRVDLLLTDLVLPGVNGRELAETAIGLHPRMRVLFMSGYTGDAATHRGLLDTGAPFLQKPITPRTLAGAVRRVLDE